MVNILNEMILLFFLNGLEGRNIVILRIIFYMYNLSFNYTLIIILYLLIIYVYFMMKMFMIYLNDDIFINFLESFIEIFAL
jgi:hypothetical protein